MSVKPKKALFFLVIFSIFSLVLHQKNTWGAGVESTGQPDTGTLMQIETSPEPANPATLQESSSIYFYLERSRETVSCYENDLIANIGSFGHFLAGAISGPYRDNGRSPEKAIKVRHYPKLFKRDILPLFDYGEVAVEKKADAKNDVAFLERWLIPVEQSVEDGVTILRVSPVQKLSYPEESNETSHLTCPEGYILVPGNPQYETPTQGKDFCMMKYEASLDESTGKAVSRPGIMPWVSIDRESAKRACEANNTPENKYHFHLVTQSEWQAAARNAESVASNWSGGAVGIGLLRRGNSNSDSEAPASADDSDYFSGTNHLDFIHKRTLTLSNGEVIWDLSGNSWEWVADDCRMGETGSFEYSNAGLSAEEMHLFGPAFAMSSAQNSGKLYKGSAGAIVRGGGFCHGEIAGLFAANLDTSPYISISGIGFRCAASPLGDG